MVYQLIYGSAATRPFTQPDLAELLRLARVNNARLGITGMLVYHDGSFLQVLEGPQAAVQTPVEKISRDDRHSKLTVFRKGVNQEREFGEWSMAFHALSSEESASLGGFKQITSLAPSDVESARFRALLKAFTKINRLDADAA